MKYIYHHLGLGDHIICNGIVRTLAEEEPISLFCKNIYAESVKAMYADSDKITVIPVQDDGEARKFLEGIPSESVERIGYSRDDFQSLSKNFVFDEVFYKQASLPFSYRWSKFYCNRNLSAESSLKEKVVSFDRYQFIHSDPERKMVINPDYLNKSLPSVCAILGLTLNILDYISIIESAEEIHVIPSSFMLLIDSIETNGKLFVHKYTRPVIFLDDPHLKKNWTIYKK
jgi:hypothetical protein